MVSIVNVVTQPDADDDSCLYMRYYILPPICHCFVMMGLLLCLALGQCIDNFDRLQDLCQLPFQEGLLFQRLAEWQERLRRCREMEEDLNTS